MHCCSGLVSAARESSARLLQRTPKQVLRLACSIACQTEVTGEDSHPAYAVGSRRSSKGADYDLSWSVSSRRVSRSGVHVEGETTVELSNAVPSQEMRDLHEMLLRPCVAESPYDAHGIPAAARVLRLHFVRSNAPLAVETCDAVRSLFLELFPTNLAEDVREADVVVSLGGDGFLLETLRNHPRLPVYGINCGHVGFLTNAHRELPRLARLLREVENARRVRAPFLQVSVDGAEPCFALNEVVVSRSTMQAANLKISINGRVVLPFMSGDGILVSTPCGSTAYNLSAGGSILPLDVPLIALTPVCPFRPRRMESALLDSRDVVSITSLGPEEKRPVHVSYDNVQLPNPAKHIEIKVSDRTGTLLLDSSTDHRIFMERFNNQ